MAISIKITALFDLVDFFGDTRDQPEHNCKKKFILNLIPYSQTLLISFS